MEDVERLAALVARQEGQIMALEMAVTTLMADHPRRDDLLHFFSRMADARLDLHLATTLPEELRTGLEEMRAQLLGAKRAPPIPPAPVQSNPPRNA